MRLALALLLGFALGWGAATLARDDDVRVDPDTPGARRAAAAALDIVPGRVLAVYRDRDNGKWEVRVDQDGGEYEVELDPADFGLLRLDYD